MIDKQIIIISGANGSGKTTFAIPYVQELGFDFLNADEIAKELGYQGQKNILDLLPFKNTYLKISFSAIFDKFI